MNIVKNHWNMHFKYVNCVVCELYLNRTGIKMNYKWGNKNNFQEGGWKRSERKGEKIGKNEKEEKKCKKWKVRSERKKNNTEKQAGKKRMGKYLEENSWTEGRQIILVFKELYGRKGNVFFTPHPPPPIFSWPLFATVLWNLLAINNHSSLVSCLTLNVK